MFELGAAMMPNDGRPVFALRRDDATLQVPADFKEKLFVRYGTLDDALDKLESDIRSAFEKDGRIAHDSIRALLAQRRKRFLSRVMLEDLGVRLKDEQITSLLKQYHTVEDVIEAVPAEIARVSTIPAHLVTAIQGELRGPNP
jgi:molecular chaperone HtpG